MSRISECGVLNRPLTPNDGTRRPYGMISAGWFGPMTDRNLSRRARYALFHPTRLSDTHAPRVITYCAAMRSCRFGNSRSFAPFGFGRGSSENGRRRVYVKVRFAPLNTAISVLATTWFSLRLRTPSPRHRPTCGFTIPADETIGSVGRYIASNAIFV